MMTQLTVSPHSYPWTFCFWDTQVDTQTLQQHWLSVKAVSIHIITNDRSFKFKLIPQELFLSMQKEADTFKTYYILIKALLQ